MNRKDHQCTIGCYREIVMFGRVFSWCSRFSYKAKENRNYLKTDLENRLTKEQFDARIKNEQVLD